MTANLDQVKAHAEAAWTLMARHKVPPTAANYAVWYDYVSGANEALRRSLDVLISNRRPLDESLCADLFERFILPTWRSDAIEGVATGLGELTQGVSQALGEAGAGLGRYGAALDRASTALDGATDTVAIELVGVLKRETEEFNRRNAALQAKLDFSANEIKALRDRLAETRREAMTDGLTGVANRKRFDAALREAAAAAMENGSALSLIMLDIDHFKAFNDNYGHQLGDQVLRLVGRTMIDSARDSDLSARYGGEEFAVVMPNADLEAARGLAERIRHRIGKRRIVRRNTGEDLGTVTLSAGVACYAFGEPVSALVERADAALYRAKQNGRDQVTTENDMPADGTTKATV
ncbi:MAG: GGDEF domain-containing protein [Alphaproteobacteria bacterium]|nr:GGDEF domain-containing protein [Alphaproteobacteria bacterium]